MTLSATSGSDVEVDGKNAHDLHAHGFSDVLTILKLQGLHAFRGQCLRPALRRAARLALL